VALTPFNYSDLIPPPDIRMRRFSLNYAVEMRESRSP
jgi:hypothetical protein